MFKLKVFCGVTIVLLTFFSFPFYSYGARGFPTSTCPNIFRYHYDESLAQWYGMILIRSPPPLGHPMELVVYLSVKSPMKVDYLGAVELLETRAESIENIRRGHAVRYRVRFPLLPALPKVTRIVLNNWMICSGPPELGFYVTEIRLEHILYTQLASHQTTSFPIEFVDEDEDHMTIMATDDDNRHENSIDFEYSDSRQPKPSHENSIDFEYADSRQPKPSHENEYNNNETSTSNSSNIISLAKDNDNGTAADGTSQSWLISDITEEQMMCGRPIVKMSHFIVDERHLSHGSWPWSVALFTREPYSGSPQDYICGGTLVSSKVVVTAAHCMQRNKRKRYANEIVAYFGRNHYEGGSAIKQQAEDIDTIIIHPDYKKFGQTFDADIAVIIVRSRIRYGKLIRPICLWPKSDEYVVGAVSDESGKEVAATDNKTAESTGTVVIWGRDGNEMAISTKPRIINVKMVGDAECLQQNTMYNEIISNRTFCAQGIQNGRAPCFGDSGSGMAVKQLNNRWYLRGIVSGGLSDPTCTANNYVVFTDASKFVNFINPYMLL